MKILRVPGIGGLYNELSNLDPNLLQSVIAVKNSTLDGSGAFWNSLFQRERIEGIIDALKSNLYADQWQIPQYRSIVANPQEFIERALQAPIEICSPSCTPKHFFSCVEIMAILCKLYSDFEFAPFQLTVQDGFQMDNRSSDALYQRSLHPKSNPYLLFVDQHILPIIETTAPDILFLEGQLDYYLAAVAMRSKCRFPNLHICLTRHASEYYSLNKIVGVLKQNQPLFWMVDSVALEYFDETEAAIVEALSADKGLQDVPNLLYKDASGIICETEFRTPSNRVQMGVYARSFDPTADIHLEPFSKCHWNQCTFCGINKKYHHEDSPCEGDAFQKKAVWLKSLSCNHGYFWFIDEALRPEQLRSLARLLLSSEINVYWQARCRASCSLLEKDLPQLLYRSGLRELRIGLESASYSVLKLMHKFDDDFRLEQIETIIRDYTDAGISIHCPMILGFPQEKPSDRRKTYEFLSEMREKYPLFTFNLNILCLDISSPLYRQAAEYQIQSIEFPCKPQYFLGNWVTWMPFHMEKDIDAERQTFTREQLYPWLPINALTPPTILYRLSETARRTLIWKAAGTWEQTPLFSFDMTLQIAPSLAVTQEAEDQYLVYCWESHHYMQGNHFLMELLDAFLKPQNVTAVIKSLVSHDPTVYRYEELADLIYKFFDHGYLVGEYLPYSGTEDKRVAATYNHIYETETYLYELKPENMLIENQQLFSPGKALELGIGMGRNMPFLLKKGFCVTGVDISDVAIRKLREQYGAQGEFWVQDVRSFSIQPASYSLIICSLVLSYLNDTDLVLVAESIKRGLKPGGYLFIKDLSAEDPLAKLPNKRAVEYRNFFTREKALQLFSGLEPIEASVVLRKEPHRLGCNGYFDLLFYLGKKPNSN